MKYEIEAASEFVTRAIFSSYDPQQQITAFYTTLCHVLANKYANHWYEKSPIQGQAYRSIIVDCENGFVDNTLLSVAKFTSVKDFFSTPRSCVS